MRLGSTYWLIVAVAAVFTLARFSEAFLLLRATSVGLPIYLVPIVMVADEHRLFAFGLSGRARFPTGWTGPRCLSSDWQSSSIADLFLGLSAAFRRVAVGVGLWGLHMGLTQGLLAALVADTAPPELRGTAFGMFNLASGVALLTASVIAGFLWDAAGPEGTFLAGGVFAALALAGLLAICLRLTGGRAGAT